MKIVNGFESQESFEAFYSKLKSQFPVDEYLLYVLPKDPISAGSALGTSS